MIKAQQHKLASLATVTFAFVALLLTACGNSESGVASSGSEGGTDVTHNATPDLQNLHSIEDLRAKFRMDDGSSRIVLLVSPT